MLFKEFFHSKKTFDSGAYWEARYASGRTSGEGSYGELASFKAKVLNHFVDTHDIETVIEHGCGDGNQLTLTNYRSYLGFDVSTTAVNKCREKFKDDQSKRFELVSDYHGEKADLTLSLDVLYHLVENDIFHAYMERLFSSAEKYVIIYSNNLDRGSAKNKAHVRFRKFTDWIESNAPGWTLAQRVENPYKQVSTADFYIYSKLPKSE